MRKAEVKGERKCSGSAQQSNGQATCAGKARMKELRIIPDNDGCYD